MNKRTVMKFAFATVASPFVSRALPSGEGSQDAHALLEQMQHDGAVNAILAQNPVR